MKLFLAAALATTALGSGAHALSGHSTLLTTAQQSEAERAMASVGLARSGSGGISFASSEYAGGDYVLTDVMLNQDDVDTRVGRMVFGNPRLDAEGDLLVSQIRLEGMMAPTDDGDALTVRSFVVERPNTALTKALIDGLTGVEDESDWRLADYQFDSISLDGVQIISMELGDSLDPMISIEALTIRNSGEERSDLILRNLSSDIPTEQGPARFNIEEFRLEGWRQDGWEDFGPAMTDQELAVLLTDSSMGGMNGVQPPYDAMSLTGLSAQIAGINLEIPSYRSDVSRDGALTIVDSRMDRMSVSADNATETGMQLAMGLAMFGYETLEARMETRSIYDSEADRAYSDGENYFEIVDGLRIDFSSDISGFRAADRAMAEAMRTAMAARADSKDKPESDYETGYQAGSEAVSEGLPASWAQLEIYNLMLSITDLSLLDRGLSAASAMQGMPKEDVRAQAALMASIGLAAAPQDIPRDFVSELSSALTAFINQGGTLIISAEPDQPFSLQGLVEAAENETPPDLSGLGLSARAEP